MEKQNCILRWMRNLLCGILIGAGAILPGVSGGVLAVIFGLYNPFMEVLTEPRRALPKYWMTFVPVVIGCGIGFIVFAKGLSTFFAVSPTVAVWLFVGLILGTAPALFREAGAHGRGKSAWGSLLLCGGVMFAGLYYISHVAAIQVTPNLGWYSFCGVLLGLGIIIPGMTSSSVLMALGLYRPVLDGLANLDVMVISACLPGVVLAILLPARFVRWGFRAHYTVAYHGILGIVLASTLVIVPKSYGGVGEILLSALCAAAGFVLALLMEHLDSRIQRKK